MELKECICSRRSVRNFSKKYVTDEIINNIIEMGLYAPNACNFQAWKFIVIRDKETKKMLINNVINKSNVSILVLYRNDLCTLGRRHYDYIQSASAAIENMLLYIHSIGLGACWICHFPKDNFVRKKLNIPKNYNCIGVIALGYKLEKEENKNYEIDQHFDSKEDYLNKKRKYSIYQVVFKETFKKTDSSSDNYPICRFRYKLKEKVFNFFK